MQYLSKSKFLVIMMSLMVLALPMSAMADKKGGKFWGKLTDQQRSQIMKLKLAFKMKKYLLKAKIKQAKVELATLMANDKPNRTAINKKVDEILALKKQKIAAKIDLKLGVRKVLTKEQRVKFDMMMLKKMYKGKKGRCGKRGYHHRGGHHGRYGKRGHGHGGHGMHHGR